jgi:hypothetical protein
LKWLGICDQERRDWRRATTFLLIAEEARGKERTGESDFSYALPLALEIWSGSEKLDVIGMLVFWCWTSLFKDGSPK